MDWQSQKHGYVGCTIPVMRWLFCGFMIALASCGGSSSDMTGPALPAPSEEAGVDAGDGSTPADAGSDGDAAPIDAGTLTACDPTVISAANAKCWALTPAETGASAAGENATMPSIALTPASNVAARGQLVVFFNGSGGTPLHAANTGAPSISFYATASALGYSVLAISYKSDASIGSLCVHDDGCYEPTRETVLLGVVQPGTASALTTTTFDEGADQRIVLALRMLRNLDSTGNWGNYLTAQDGAAGAAPEMEIDWTKIVASGHSQGGGHAALLGKLFPVARVVMLSSPCDSIADNMPATWTARSGGGFATNAPAFHGLAAPSTLVDGTLTGDTTCPYHSMNWDNLQVPTAQRNDDAATCGITGDTHTASLKCQDNAPNWQTLLQ